MRKKSDQCNVSRCVRYLNSYHCSIVIYWEDTVNKFAKLNSLSVLFISYTVVFFSVNAPGIAKCHWKFPATFYLFVNIMLLQQNVGETFNWYFAFVYKMSMETSSDIFFFYLKVSMMFAFAIKTSVKLFTDILHVFKMSMEISIDILSVQDIDDILLLFAKTAEENFNHILHLFAKCRWKFPSTFCRFCQ